MFDRIFYGRFDLVGMYYLDDRSELKRTLEIGLRLFPERQRDNKADKNAVAVTDGRGRLYGYIRQRQNTELAFLMDSGVEFIAEVTDYKIKRTGAAAVLALYSISRREVYFEAIEKYKRYTLLEEIKKLQQNDNEDSK